MGILTTWMFKYYPQLLENELDYLGRDFSEDSSRGGYGGTGPQLEARRSSRDLKQMADVAVIKLLAQILISIYLWPTLADAAASWNLRRRIHLWSVLHHPVTKV